MKKFNVYVKVKGETRKYVVQHFSHPGAIRLVGKELMEQKHGAILAVEVTA